MFGSFNPISYTPVGVISDGFGGGSIPQFSSGPFFGDMIATDPIDSDNNNVNPPVVGDNSIGTIVEKDKPADNNNSGAGSIMSQTPKTASPASQTPPVNSSSAGSSDSSDNTHLYIAAGVLLAVVLVM